MVSPVRKAAFTLKDILNDSQIIDLILNSARITKRSDRESSFCVYGGFDQYYFTKALEEELDAVIGIREDSFIEGESAGGITFTKEGYGSWVPKDKYMIIHTHFHPLDSTAIPSVQDLKAQLYFIQKNWNNSSSPFFNPIFIVGHYSPEDQNVRLFLGQFVLPEAETPWKRFAVLAHDLPDTLDLNIRQQLGDNYYELDHEDPTLSEKAARVLNLDGKYRAHTLTFPLKNEFGYWDQVENWESFPLLAPPFTASLDDY